MTVEIRLSTRPGWYQLSELPIDSAALGEHLARLALADWTRLRGRIAIEVVAHERDGPREAVVVLDRWRARVRIRRGRGSQPDPA